MGKNIGYVFEDIVYEELRSLNIFDEIHHETELTRMYGWDASSIDYMLVYKNKVIVVQTKWRKTRRREDAGIHKFIRSINYMKGQVNGKKQFYGLWVSRREPFEDNIQFLGAHNVSCISNFNSMTSAAKEMVSALHTICS
jgi:hypothetical protein